MDLIDSQSGLAKASLFKNLPDMLTQWLIPGRCAAIRTVGGWRLRDLQACGAAGARSRDHIQADSRPVRHFMF
jgi:hypothetical protein